MVHHLIRQHRARLTVAPLEDRCVPAAYSIVDLLPPAGSSASAALGLNDSGAVVGTALPTGTSFNRPAAWKIGTEATAAGTFLPLPGGDTGGLASDVNNAGTAVGVTHVAGVEGPNRAVVWTGGNPYVPHDLGNPGGFNSSQATALSEPDAYGVTWVVGMSQSIGDPSQPEHAITWRVNASGAVLSTIDLEPTLLVSRAKDVRLIDPSAAAGDEYVLVAGEVKLPGMQTAAVWKLDLAGNVLNRTDLGTLGGSVSYGFGINQSGHVAGMALPAAGTYRASLYRDGAMLDLGSLTTGMSQAFAVNDADTVVGQCTIYNRNGVSDGTRAFVWQNGSMLDLRAQLSSAVRSNWSALWSALDVNAAGQIAGRGTVGKGGAAQGHGFVMTPPALLAASAGTGGGRRLQTDEVRPILSEAIERWRRTGADVSPLAGLRVRIADLGGTTLGVAAGNVVTVDDDGAGWGWFIDRTPGSDAEFRRAGNQGERGRMDLLTVLVHEVGHVLGHDHDEGGVMAETLAAARRAGFSPSPPASGGEGWGEGGTALPPWDAVS